MYADQIAAEDGSAAAYGNGYGNGYAQLGKPSASKRKGPSTLRLLIVTIAGLLVGSGSQQRMTAQHCRHCRLGPIAEQPCWVLTYVLVLSRSSCWWCCTRC